jgi:hypothetical protein
MELFLAVIQGLTSTRIRAHPSLESIYLYMAQPLKDMHDRVALKAVEMCLPYGRMRLDLAVAC